MRKQFIVIVREPDAKDWYLQRSVNRNFIVVVSSQKDALYMDTEREAEQLRKDYLRCSIFRDCPSRTPYIQPVDPIDERKKSLYLFEDDPE